MMINLMTINVLNKECEVVLGRCKSSYPSCFVAAPRPLEIAWTYSISFITAAHLGKQTVWTRWDERNALNNSTSHFPAARIYHYTAMTSAYTNTHQQ